MSQKRSCSLLRPPLPPAEPRDSLRSQPPGFGAAPSSAGLCGEVRGASRVHLGICSSDSGFPEAPRHGAGRGSPSLELAGQLVQDLHGLPVVVQLGVHQGRELAHLLDLQASSGTERPRSGPRLQAASCGAP